MKKFISHFARIIFGAALFCIFFLEVSLTPLIFGAITGLIFSLLSSRIERNKFGFWGVWSVKYYLSLFKDMLHSTIFLTIAVFKKNPPTVVIKSESAACDERGQVLVSNSITLTPGTLTLEQKDDVYTILMLNNDSSKDKVASHFEKNLR